MDQSYYTPPTDDIFNEVKAMAYLIWDDYDDTHGYATEKINKITPMLNIEDNVMSIVAMFDIHNQQKLAAKLTLEAREAVASRMKDGGQLDHLNPFYINK